jgi:type III secretion protein SpaR/YscT/HrcT
MENYVVLFVLSFCRVFGFMKQMPQLKELKLPQGMKFIIFLSITPFVVLGQNPESVASLSIMTLALLAAKEVLIGIFLGFFVSLPFHIPTMIGDLIDNQRGGAMNTQQNPALGTESSVLGMLLALTAVTYFYSEGGLTRLVTILAASFELQSVYSYEFGFGDHFLDVSFLILNNFMQLFAILSLPVVIVMMAVDLSLGYTSRFAQSLNAFNLSQPIKALVALLMVISIHPQIISGVNQFFNRVVEVLL